VDNFKLFNKKIIKQINDDNMGTKAKEKVTLNMSSKTVRQAIRPG